MKYETIAPIIIVMNGVTIIPIVDWYLKQTGQSLVKNGVPVGHGYAAAPAPAAADATSGASDSGHGAAPAPAAAPAADATSGATA